MLPSVFGGLVVPCDSSRETFLEILFLKPDLQLQVPKIQLQVGITTEHPRSRVAFFKTLELSAKFSSRRFAHSAKSSENTVGEAMRFVCVFANVRYSFYERVPRSCRLQSVYHGPGLSLTRLLPQPLPPPSTQRQHFFESSGNIKAANSLSALPLLRRVAFTFSPAFERFRTLWEARAGGTHEVIQNLLGHTFTRVYVVLQTNPPSIKQAHTHEAVDLQKSLGANKENRTSQGG